MYALLPSITVLRNRVFVCCHANHLHYCVEDNTIIVGSMFFICAGICKHLIANFNAVGILCQSSIVYVISEDICLLSASPHCFHSLDKLEKAVVITHTHARCVLSMLFARSIIIKIMQLFWKFLYLIVFLLILL